MKKIVDNKEDIRILLKKYNVIPKNIELYVQAFTHASYSRNDSEIGNYERLEFLGDAIIQFVSSEYFYKQFLEFPQGKLTTVRSRTVSTEALSKIALKMGLTTVVRTGGGKMESDVRQSPKVQADLFEALVAAIFLDYGMPRVKDFITKSIFPSVDKLGLLSKKDPKSALQEYFQSISRENIKYTVDQLPDKLFLAKAVHNKKIYGMGKGVTKKEAEVHAAVEALKKLNKKIIENKKE